MRKSAAAAIAATDAASPSGNRDHAPVRLVCLALALALLALAFRIATIW
jgi:nicotinamide mononucleotide (NMN) deamidase PncC